MITLKLQKPIRKCIHQLSLEFHMHAPLNVYVIQKHRKCTRQIIMKSLTHSTLIERDSSQLGYAFPSWVESFARSTWCLSTFTSRGMVGRWIGAPVPFVGNHATQVARVPCVHPLETWVQRFSIIMWFLNSDGVRRWFVLNGTRGLWLLSSRGCISSGLFCASVKTPYFKKK